MALLSRDPEKQKIREEKQRAEQEAQAENDFLNSPQGLARDAYKAGQKFFQIVLPVSETARTVLDVMGGGKEFKTTHDGSHPHILEDIESEGWHLEHANLLFEETGSVSRDKFSSSGQTVKVTGRIVGVYLFRAIEESR